MRTKIYLPRRRLIRLCYLSSMCSSYKTKNPCFRTMVHDNNNQWWSNIQNRRQSHLLTYYSRQNKPLIIPILPLISALKGIDVISYLIKFCYWHLTTLYPIYSDWYNWDSVFHISQASLKLLSIFSGLCPVPFIAIIISVWFHRFFFCMHVSSLCCFWCFFASLLHLG